MTRPLRIALLVCASCFILLSRSASASTPASTQLDAPVLSTPDPLATSFVHLVVASGTSGAPFGFTIEWMTQAQYDANGDVWPDETDPRVKTASFYGFPSLNTVDGTTTFMLSPDGTADIEIGDIFDETGVQSVDRSELTQGTSFVFRVKANGDGGDPTGGTGLVGGSSLQTSTYSATQYASTKTPPPTSGDCVFTQGFWKTHPTLWPIPSITLGTQLYTEAQMLLIFNTPAAGNGLISLAHQLAAVKLNIATGAIAPPVTLAAVSAADALIGNLLIPPIGSGFLSPATTSNLNDLLESFNALEGKGTIQCSHVVATHVHTWGDLKALYR
jgi:hypothetical protein